MTESGTVQFGNTTINYQVQRSERRKTVSIGVDHQGVTLTAPSETDSSHLQQLVYSRGPWIIRKQSNLRDSAQVVSSERRFVSGEEVRYLGRQYRLKRIPNTQKVRLYGRFLEIPDLENIPLLRSLIVEWFCLRAEERLPERVQLYSRRLGVSVPPIFVRDQQSRWGSCNAKGELRFNWRIIMAPMSLVDYVVAHELCHLEHLDHSSSFWKRLRQIMPDYRKRRDRLAELAECFDFKPSI
jgi:predicted metal-dependent hydrolase